MLIYYSDKDYLVKRADAALENVYEKDVTTNAFVIAAAIDKYTDIFNELDPSPLRRRDLNTVLKVFLEDCSADIPLKYNVVLKFSIAGEVPDPEKESRIKLGLKTYFSFVHRLLDREIKESYQQSVSYVGIAFLLLLMAYSLGTIPSEDFVFKTLLVGINIGGWVFLWEAISTFAFKKRNVKNERAYYKRFTAAQIRFSYVSACARAAQKDR